MKRIGFEVTSRIASGYGARSMRFIDSDGNGGRSWIPEEQHVYFVPREHILGRPLATFWPLSQIGFIR